MSLLKSYEESMKTAHKFLSVFLSKCVVFTHFDVITCSIVEACVYESRGLYAVTLLGTLDYCCHSATEFILLLECVYF